MKKVIILLLILMMIVSCGGNTSDEVNDTTTRPDETTEDTTFKLPEYNFDGYKYNILTAAEQWAHYYVAESENGDIINDAVYARNSAVEEMYNVTLNYQVFNGYGAGMPAVATALKGAVLSGTDEFDLVISGTVYISGHILDGLFMDMNTIDTIDLANPWWYKKVNDELIIANKAYTVVGEYSLMAITNSWCVYFNSALIKDFELENPYVLVNNGKWTFDKMIEMGMSVCADLNGNGKPDEEDRFGLLTGVSEAFYAMRYAMGSTITNIGSDGYPILVGASEKTVTVFDKLKALNNNKEFLYNYKNSLYVEQIPIFVGGQALFYSYPIKATENAVMRNFEDYGIIPQPKLDEAQEEYYALCLGDGYQIPAVVNDADMSGAVLETLNWESYMNVTSRYYDVALQGKFTRDNESAAMLDLIRANSIMDFGALYYSALDPNLMYIHNIFNREYTSWWQGIETSVQKKLDNIIEQMKAIS